jgi:hypothetical protein
MLCTGWGCGGVNVLPLLSGFSCKVYLWCLSTILLLEARFLLPPSSHHLGIPLRINLFKMLVQKNKCTIEEMQIILKDKMEMEKYFKKHVYKNTH